MERKIELKINKWNLNTAIKLSFLFVSNEPIGFYSELFVDYNFTGEKFT